MRKEEIEIKIKQIEQEIQETPYHKGTEHHIGKLKAKLAKLRNEIIQKSGKKGAGSGFAIKKQGDATVVLVGLPSVGKSTLLNKLTKAHSKVADYDFTTLNVIPGIMDYKGTKIQILDVPGLIQGASLGKGRGKEVLSVIRVVDLILMIASAEKPEAFDLMEKELFLAGVRLNQKKPDVLIEKKLKGGIEIVNPPKSISEKTIKSIAQDLGVLNAKISFGQNIDQDQFIDALMGNRVYVPSLKIISKIDSVSKKELNKFFKREWLPVSALQNIRINELKEKIFQKLNLIRIYLKKSIKANPDKQPLICQRGITVFQAAAKISQGLSQEIRGAKITGPSAAYANQFVGPAHILKDEDEVFFIK